MRVLPLLVLLTACVGNSMDGGFGVSPGGQQDLELARELIEDGQIPARDHFTAEGLFSEHDLPLEGEACTQLLCPRGAAAYQTPVNGGSARYVTQLGFGTSITEANFTRAPVRLVATIDTSGSMEGTDRLGAVQDALLAMIPQLDEQDELAIVTYGTKARVVAPLKAMDSAGREAMARVVRNLSTEGSTNMESGMAVAYDLLAEGGNTSAEERVMLFTDAQPNTGDTSQEGFLGLVRDGAQVGIGITVLGVGLDLGSELADALARTRGGNSYYMPDAARGAELFEDEFPFMVTPLAYDLAVDLVPAEGITLRDGYGMPVDGGTGALGASTLFLSRTDGALAITLDGPALDPGAHLATLSLSYAPADGAPVVTDALDVTWQGGTARAGEAGVADDLGPYKLSVLLDAYQALESGADLCATTLPSVDALARIDLAAARLDAVATELSDAPIGELGVLIGKLGDLARLEPPPCASPDAYLY